MNRRIKTKTAAAVLLSTIALMQTACSNPPPGSPGVGSESTPASPSGTANESSLPHHGAPKVSSPLPASVLAGNPCQDAFTATQLKTALGVTPAGKANEIPTGPTCSWANQETGGLVSVNYVTRDHGGLSTLYANTKPQAVVWQELPPIQGFPAVAYTVSGKNPPDEFCQIAIGLADDLSIDVGSFLGDLKTASESPCEIAVQIADMAVTTLKQKAGQ